MHDISPAASAAAHRAAVTGASRAGVTVREITDCAGYAAASVLFARVWGTSTDSSPLQSDLLASLVHAQACVMGASAGQDLVGAAVCLAGPPRSCQVYSIIAGVVGGKAGHGVGGALKLGQRAWALDRGATRMVWTFDPLVGRNAHFNINKLGARVSSYIPDFFPPMHDAINSEDLTDRLVAEWDLVGPAHQPVDPDGVTEVLGPGDSMEPIQHDAGDASRLSVRIPYDIEELRRTDPQLGRAWRLAVREALQASMSRGYRVVDFSRAGSYLLERGCHD